jgi:hypothetical protein
LQSQGKSLSLSTLFIIFRRRKKEFFSQQFKRAYLLFFPAIYRSGNGIGLAWIEDMDWDLDRVWIGAGLD